MHVKMEDKVFILTGKDKGMTGDVIAIDRAKGRIKVSRRNMVFKHKKPNAMLGQDGARIEQENWLDASNVALYSDETSGPVRVAKRFVGKGNELFNAKHEAIASFGDTVPDRIQKVRVAKKSGEVFDTIK